MRISSNQAHSQALNQMLNLQRQMADTQNQISTGKKYSTPADDPLAAVRVERLNRDLAVREQYQKNLDLAESELSLEEASLTQAGNLLQRVRELTVQAGNPINGAQEREFIATEIETRLDELMQLMNTRLASGDYLFGGTAGGRPPFVRESDGMIRYQGDDGQRAVQIDATTRLPVNDSGKRLFVNVAAAQTVASAKPHPNNAAGGSGAVTVADVVDQEALNALYPDGLIVEFEPLSEDPDGLPNFTLRRRSDNRPVDGLQNVRYQPGTTISAGGVELELHGEPRAGDRFIVNAIRTQSVLDTVAKLANGLNTLDANGADSAAYRKLMDDSLGNIDNALSSILEVRADIGARMGVVESVRFMHEQVEVMTTELKSSLEDVDFAKAISDLTQQSLLLQAAQQSFVRVSRLSLFDAI